jgi:hypothetical protein
MKAATNGKVQVAVGELVFNAYVFTNAQIALEYTYRRKGAPHFVVLGDAGQVWIVTAEAAEKLEAAGYQIVK